MGKGCFGEKLKALAEGHVLMMCECTPTLLCPDTLETVCEAGWVTATHLLARPRLGTSIFQARRELRGFSQAALRPRTENGRPGWSPGPRQALQSCPPLDTTLCGTRTPPAERSGSAFSLPERRALSLGTRGMCLCPRRPLSQSDGKSHPAHLHKILLCPVLSWPGGARRCLFPPSL